MSQLLSYQNFKAEVQSKLKGAFPEDYPIDNICIKEICKNNDTFLDAILINHSTGTCTPAIYLHNLYHDYTNGASINDLLKYIVDLNLYFTDINVVDKNFVTDILTDLKKVKPFIECKLVNKSKNCHRLSDKPYKSMGEFALYYQIKVATTNDGYYITPVLNDMLVNWGITVDELDEIAMANMDMLSNFTLTRMDDFLPEGCESPMLVLSNEHQIDGATMIISKDVQQLVSLYLGGDYYILPSSVHEVIILPKQQMTDISSLEQIVREVNNTSSVPSEDFLSNNVYEYISSKEDLRIAKSTKYE